MTYTAKTWGLSDPFTTSDASEMSAAIADNAADSGWLSAGIVDYRKLGNIVYATWYRNTNISAGATVTVGTLPVGYRPSRTTAVSCSRGLQDGFINTAGAISITNSDTVARTHFGHVSFPVG